MAENHTHTIEVIYVPPIPLPVFRRFVPYVCNITVLDVLQSSEIFSLYPETITSAVGIFSKIVTQATIVEAGSRVEVYRKLIFDPKENRRKRAQNYTKQIS